MVWKALAAGSTPSTICMQRAKPHTLTIRPTQPPESLSGGIGPGIERERESGYTSQWCASAKRMDRKRKTEENGDENTPTSVWVTGVWVIASHRAVASFNTGHTHANTHPSRTSIWGFIYLFICLAMLKSTHCCI